MQYKLCAQIRERGRTGTYTAGVLLGNFPLKNSGREVFSVSWISDMTNQEQCAGNGAGVGSGEVVSTLAPGAMASSGVAGMGGPC